MTAIQYSFSKVQDADFISTLKKRVHGYFQENNISRHGDARMVIKTVVMLGLYFVPLALMLSGLITQVWLIFVMWIVMGLGMSGIGMSVTHDANHGAYSKKRWVNNLLGKTMNLMGVSSELWKIQHNMLHHTYTNIDGHDEDIHVPVVLRFSPHQRHRWIHRFQFLYVWIFYGISTLWWITTKDFIQIAKYKREGFIPGKKFRKELTRLIAWKVFYYGYSIVLPILLIPVSPWIVLAAFVSMHLVVGLFLSIIFQAAHVMPNTEFPEPPDDGNFENNWAVHQLLTTTNFAQKSRIFSWFIGGLNYQVEHHLFSNICHVHYRALSKIVRETAREFGIQYNTQKSFLSALWAHVRMLYALGQGSTAPVLVPQPSNVPVQRGR
ncbi:MAG: acyl-CoA desaturase [Saprospiraceae bacterium]|nr:acyl-CoA desaturase [Saprospiraceae bacterium]